jgi:hypothetical protein
VRLAVESRRRAVAVLVGLLAGAVQFLLALHDPDRDQAADHHVVEVRLPVGIDGDAHELGHGDGAVLDHLHDVSRVHGEVGCKVGGLGRRQLRDFYLAGPNANDPARSDENNNDLLMTASPNKIAAGVCTAASALNPTAVSPPCQSCFGH